MLGMAEVPPPPLPRARDGEPPSLDNRRRADALHVAHAPAVREASAAAAEAVVRESRVANARAQLPAPNRDPARPPPLLAPADLRTLVGQREKREPVEVVLGWARELGRNVEGGSIRAIADGAKGPELVAWAEATGRLHDAMTPPERGDLLVFDRVNSDDEADLIAVVIARDERGVTEMLYVGGGVVRRGFVDVGRPTTKRDQTGAIVNTFVRHGRRWPAKGSHYLAGEHLAHVIR